MQDQFGLVVIDLNHYPEECAINDLLAERAKR